MNLLGNFSFYPVGQGCFYGGSINYKGNKFVIVYDCGTVSSQSFVNDAIIDFKTRYKKIDLLMISHFDKDHVSGLQNLLSGIHCERVVIPYYEPLTRLMLLAKYPYDDDYANFLRNPIEYIAANGNVGEIIIMEGNIDGENAIRALAKPDSPIPDFNGEFDMQILGNTRVNQELRDKVIANEEISTSTSIQFLKIPTTFVLSEIWEFVFYLKDFGNPAGIVGFKSGIDELLATTADGKLQSLFNPHFVPLIHKLYTTHLSEDINFTSLCVYHGPVHRCRSIYLNGLNIVRYSGFMKNSKSGTLLTGDSFIKNTIDYEPFYKYYSPIYIDQCFFFQVPHHGSEKNWNMFPNGLSSIPFYIINHGFKRKKHPSVSVLSNINTNSVYKFILSNHQFQRIDYSIKALP